MLRRQRKTGCSAVRVSLITLVVAALTVGLAAAPALGQTGIPTTGVVHAVQYIPPPGRAVIYACQQEFKTRCAGMKSTPARNGFPVVTRFRSGRSLYFSGVWSLAPDGSIGSSTRNVDPTWYKHYKGTPLWLIENGRNPEVQCLDRASLTSILLVYGPCGEYTWAWSNSGGAIWSFYMGPPHKSLRGKIVAPGALTLSPTAFDQGWIGRAWPMGPSRAQIMVQVPAYTEPEAEPLSAPTTSAQQLVYALAALSRIPITRHDIVPRVWSCFNTSGVRCRRLIQCPSK